MIITIRETKTTTREINIEFPFITYDSEDQKYYFNYDLNKCIEINIHTQSIFHSRYSNSGFEYEQVSKEQFYKEFDMNMQQLLELLNK